ncbi:MerR family transcriptional regulator [Rhodococcus sp. H29-C3]|uniref:helix-turn-helix domain-containing protein n=1 Tax=Rhodococcus sp. H29-C3 TaxID=3046307 RepID=UPI0024BAF4F0|nr:MerR family transcriptional regulator [Rhodococcus sp. H29-C3]MDJ0362501.1 MerR family transcriptional regulator [Rhodococcus sp. H29-C3]
MRIGEAAQLVDVPDHVLRHWDDMGVVVPDRTAAGHRDYTAEHVHRLRVLRACQSVGMSLADIKRVLHRGKAGRAEMIAAHLRRIRIRQAQLNDAETFLTHVVGCVHDLLTRCPDCSTYGRNAYGSRTVD